MAWPCNRDKNNLHAHVVRVFKLNIDGGSKGNPTGSCMAGAIADSDGHVGKRDPNRSKALAIKEGLILISEHFHGQMLIDAIQSRQ